jgi:hypothetical protein
VAQKIQLARDVLTYRQLRGKRQDQALTEAVSKMEATVASWSRIMEDNEESYVGEDLEHYTKLKAVQTKYKSLCAEQSEIRSSGQFLRDVAFALTKMPRVRDLKFRIGGDDVESVLSSADECCPDKTVQGIYDHMLRPLASPRNVSSFSWQMDWMFKWLPPALASAGVVLDSLCIEVASIESLSPTDLGSTPGPPESLDAASPLHIQRIELDLIGYIGAEGDTLQPTSLSAMAKSLYKSPILERVHIATEDSVHGFPDRTLDVSLALSSVVSPNVRYLSLENVSVEVEVLQEFLDRPKGHRPEIRLDNIVLIGRSWVDFLDNLRAADLEVVNLEANGENICDYMVEACHPHWGELFRCVDDDPKYRSYVELYVNGVIDKNPLRVLVAKAWKSTEIWKGLKEELGP